MPTAVQLAMDPQPPTLKKGGVVMMHDHSNGVSTPVLLSRRALRIELIGAVAATLLIGRLVPEFGALLRQVVTLLFG
ncbi:MAG: hypothetical protein JF614_09730 [Acidobacteria bacterium]|nr:hypothetical protein [Acidobacteriota bacterium]